jgi:hypothetical protein
VIELIQTLYDDLYMEIDQLKPIGDVKLDMSKSPSLAGKVMNALNENKGQGKRKIYDLEERINKIESQITKKGKHYLFDANAMSGLFEILRQLNRG